MKTIKYLNNRVNINSMRFKMLCLLFLLCCLSLRVNASVVNDQTNSFTTSDSVNIYYDVYYDNAISNAPVLVISPAFSSDNTRVQQRDTANYFAGLGYFVINVDSRGKGSSGGSDDMNGLECIELTEVFADAELEFSSYMGDLKYIGGGSGGGGTAMTCLVKYPDFFNAGFSWFGISNYTSWWYEEPDYRSIIEGFMSSTTPNNNYESYESRGALSGVQNIYSPLILMHNASDYIVSASHSRNINTSLNALNRDVEYYENDIVHSATISDKTHIDNTADFLDDKTSEITIPNNVGLTILGFLKTKFIEVDFDNVNKIGNLGYYKFEDEYNFKITALSHTGNIDLIFYDKEPSTTYYLTYQNGSSQSTNSNADGEVYFTIYNLGFYTLDTETKSAVNSEVVTQGDFTAKVYSRNSISGKVDVI